VAGLEKNQASRFKSAQDDSMVVEDESGVEHLIRGNQLDRITVCEEKELEFRTGEQLQIKANLKAKEGFRLANGSIVTLGSIDPETGDIQVKDRQDRVLTLDPAVRMLQYGYASTSSGSQGKTVDHVLISDSQCKASKIVYSKTQLISVLAQLSLIGILAKANSGIVNEYIEPGNADAPG
jgi:hypothetical protein